MSQGAPVVRFRSVNKSYDGKQLVVDGLDLDVFKGEFVSLLGPSGSGKTTCLMMLAGFEPVTRGDIFLNDTPIQNIPPAKRNIGMVFQNYALFPHMTVAENLAFPLKIRKQDESTIKARVTEVLAMVRLEGFGNRRICQLSGGQQQRVAVARAIAFDPEIVLMDEPLGALDKNLREELQFEIKRLHQRLGLTVVYVTHDQTEAITMSDRVAVFDQGRVQQLSDPKELYDSPSNVFVANFIGENNLLKGKVEMVDHDVCTLKFGENILKGVSTSAIEKGEDAYMSVRPEKVLIEPDTAQVNNLLTGTVTQRIYMGDHMRVWIQLKDQTSLVIKVLNHHKAVQFEKGTDLRVGWDSQQCCVLGR